MPSAPASPPHLAQGLSLAFHFSCHMPGLSVFCPAPLQGLGTRLRIAGPWPVLGSSAQTPAERVERPDCQESRPLYLRHHHPPCGSVTGDNYSPKPCAGCRCILAHEHLQWGELSTQLRATLLNPSFPTCPVMVPILPISNADSHGSDLSQVGFRSRPTLQTMTHKVLLRDHATPEIPLLPLRCPFHVAASIHKQPCF